MSEAAPSPSRAPVLAVASNKGGVGKTTVASNLAVYLRALREDLPVLVIGLDDQHTLDRMFSLGPAEGGGNLKHAWSERSFDRLIQLGEYGVHFVPSPPDGVALKARASDPRTLRRILDHTEWRGVVILDAKSDLEALTRNALCAADRILVPVSDRAALEEAGRLYRMLERDGVPAERARILLTLVDRRTRVEGAAAPMADHLAREAQRRGYALYRTRLSRSPRVESLNSGGGQPLSILHHAAGTAVHAELRGLAEEVLVDFGWPPLEKTAKRARKVRAAPPAPGLSVGLRRALLRGLGVQ